MDRHGAEARFEALYRDTRADLLAYLVRRAGDAQDAADALAETYLIAWEKLERVPVGPEARLWLFGVARNVSLRGARRRAVAGALTERLAAEVRAAAPPEAGDGARALGVLAGLAPIEREIVTLAAWEGLAPREIARVLGLSPNVVRVRLHRARARLRRELARDAEPPGHVVAALLKPDA